VVKNKKYGRKVRKLLSEQEEVIEVDFSKWPYSIKTKNIHNNEIHSRKALSCIVAMGATQELLNIPGIQGNNNYWGKGISSCAICDGGLYKNKIVGIVGSGDKAITEAYYLSNIAKEVLMFIRKDKLKSKNKLSQEINSKKNIKIFYNTEIKEVKGDNEKLTSLVTFNDKEKAEKNLNVDGLFIAIGSKPNSQIFEKQLELDSTEHIILKKDQETSKKGIFAVGDIADPKYKQAISAAGDGCKAALQVQNFLEQLGYIPETRSRSIKENTTELSPNSVVNVNSETELTQLLNNNNLVIVDFYSPYCFPCKMLSPIFETLAENYSQRITFAKINIDDSNNLLNKFHIQEVPSLLFIQKGQVINKVVGTLPFEDLKTNIKQTFNLT